MVLGEEACFSTGWGVTHTSGQASDHKMGAGDTLLPLAPLGQARAGKRRDRRGLWQGGGAATTPKALFMAGRQRIAGLWSGVLLPPSLQGGTEHPR